MVGKWNLNSRWHVIGLGKKSISEFENEYDFFSLMSENKILTVGAWIDIKLLDNQPNRVMLYPNISEDSHNLIKFNLRFYTLNNISRNLFSIRKNDNNLVLDFDQIPIHIVKINNIVTTELTGVILDKETHISIGSILEFHIKDYKISHRYFDTEQLLQYNTITNSQDNEYLQHTTMFPHRILSPSISFCYKEMFLAYNEDGSLVYPVQFFDINCLPLTLVHNQSQDSLQKYPIITKNFLFQLVKSIQNNDSQTFLNNLRMYNASINEYLRGSQKLVLAMQEQHSLLIARNFALETRQWKSNNKDQVLNLLNNIINKNCSPKLLYSIKAFVNLFFPNQSELIPNNWAQKAETTNNQIKEKKRSKAPTQ